MKKKVTAMLLVGLALVFAATTPSQAREGERGVIASPHHFEGHRAAHHWGGPRVFIGVGPSYAWGAAYPYAEPVYTPSSTTYWYCASYGAYYPGVATCPEPWVPVTEAP